MIGLQLLLCLCQGRIWEYDLKYTENDGQLNYGLMNEWTEFKQKHNKNYAAEEEKARYEIFKMNFAKIWTHNKLFGEGKVAYTMAVNKFTDLTYEEKIAYYTGLVVNKENDKYSEFNPDVKLDVPSTVDWRSKNVVTPVKNQGNCGSCYTFSATGCMEGQYAIKNGHLISLSEQNLIDCSSDYGNMGCNGGLMDSCYEYVKHNGGIDTESMYPYKAKEGSCKYKPNKFPLSSHSSIPETNETALMLAVAQVGPISVAIEVRDDFVHYSGGVFSDPHCNPGYLNHGVLVVGYGVENGQDYWLVKNSWGADWGVHGYIKMARNKNNNCGIASLASYPIL